MFKDNNKDTRTTSKSIRKTPERLEWRRSGVFIINAVAPYSSMSIVGFEYVNVC